MIGKQPLPLTSKIIDKIRDEIVIKTDKKHNGVSLAELADRCDCDPVFLGFIKKGERGPGIKLDYAIRIWTGLGHPPETLIADCNVEPILAERIKRIQEGEYAELLTLLINVLFDIAFVEDVRELAKVEGYLEAIYDRIVKLKDQRPAGCGEKLSNLSKD